MAKVLSVIPKQSKDGTKTYYNVALEKQDGSQVGATAFEELKIGDVVEEARIVPDKEGKGFIIKSLSRSGGKGTYQRNDELIVAQCAFKGMVDLLIAGQIPAANTGWCILLARMIWDTATALKASSPAAKPETKSAPVVAKTGTYVTVSPDELDVAAMDWVNATPKDFNNERNRLYHVLGWGGDQVKEFLIHEGYPDGVVPLAKRYIVLEHLKAKCPKEVMDAYQQQPTIDGETKPWIGGRHGP